MGQKVSPHGLRVGVIKDWDSKWYADKQSFADYLVEDNTIREYIKKKLYAAGVSRVVIERRGENEIRVTAAVGRPGLVIGKDGSGIDQVKNELARMTGKNVVIDIKEVRRSELDAQLTAESIAAALEKRVAFRRAMKQAIGRTMKAGAKGIKVLTSGRLGGAEIARSEKYSEGNVPLHTLRADIDYGFAEADTAYGKVGVKVWINHGEILDKGLKETIREEKQENRRDRRGRDGRRGRRDRRDGNRNDRRRNNNNDRGALPKAAPRVRKIQKVEPEVEAPAEANEAVEAPVQEAPAEE